MADPAKDGVLYGQFGRTVYDHDDKSWYLERSTANHSTLQPLGQPRLVSHATAAPDVSSFGHDSKEVSSRRRENQAKALIKIYPELQPAVELLPDLSRVSEAVEIATSRHDPCKGNLVAFGIVTDQLQKAPVTVAAFPTGPNGSDLRLVQVQKQRRGWEDSKKAWLDVPTIYGEEATWSGPGVPIQSVIFAELEDRQESYLAVRLITKTVIFRPVLRKLPSHAGGSRLDVNLLFELRMEQTGGLPHADVAFNPWSTRQFAVADQACNWSVWELERRDGGKAKSLYSGSLSWDHHNRSGKPLNDGWARIAWIGTPTTVAVFGRSRAILVDLATGEAEESEGVAVGPGTSFGWYLDVRRLPLHPSHLCVLTSMHIHIYRIQRDQHERLSALCITTIRHFRHHEDISLRLRCFSEADDASIILRSSMSPVVVRYRLRFVDNEMITVEDPTELLVPFSADLRQDGSTLLDLHSEAVPLQWKDSSPSILAESSTYAKKRVYLWSVTTLHNDLALYQRLYCARGANAQTRAIEPPSWERKLIKSVPLMPEDDFVVEDDDLESVGGTALRSEPVSAYIQQRREQAASKAELDWTVNFELTVQRLNEVDVSEVTDLNQILEEATYALERDSIDEFTSIRTLRELADSELTVHDVGQASVKLQGLRSLKPSTEMNNTAETENEQTGSPARLVLRSVQTRLPAAGGSDHLSSIHNEIRRCWVDSLPVHTSALVRLSREQLASRMAVEVAAAGQVLRLETPEEVQQSQDHAQSQEWELPLRPVAASPSPRATPSVYFDASSQLPDSTPPTPSPSAARSAITASSHPSTIAAPEIARLSRYTTFSKHAPPTLPRRLNRILSHWTPGTDPAAYDWLSTSRNVTRRDEEEVEDEEMTEKERSRMRRRTERYIRRQRKEAEQGQKQQALSSQAPGIVSASQPQAAMKPKAESQHTAGGSSQTLGFSQQPASQVLPGRHGGRPPAKKRRKSGF